MTRLEAIRSVVAAVVFRIPQGVHRTGAPRRPGPDDTVFIPRINANAHPYPKGDQS